MSISVSQHVHMSIQSHHFADEIRGSFEKCDAACVEYESTGSPIQIAQGVVQQNLGFVPAIGTPTCIGKLVTVNKLLIRTDIPCLLYMTFTGGTQQTIPLTDVLLINGSISEILVSTPTGPINLKYTAAGTTS